MSEVSQKYPVRAFVFDLDGTLVDSKRDIVESVNAMLSETGRGPLPFEQVAGFIGHGAPALIARVLGPDVDPAVQRECLSRFLTHYQEHKLRTTRPYPGVLEGLRALRAHSLAVLSNKPQRLSEEILAGLGLAGYFERVYGGDSFETRKPDPAGTRTLLKELGVLPSESALVGDSDVDIQTARNSGLLAVMVRYGFGPHDRESFPADLYIDRLEELLVLT